MDLIRQRIVIVTRMDEDLKEAREIIIQCLHDKFINDDKSIYIEGWFDFNKFSKTLQVVREEEKNKKEIEILKHHHEDCVDVERQLLESKLLASEELVEELGEDLLDYGVHYRDCVCSQNREGRLKDDGGYESLYGYGKNEKWYQRNEEPPCSCGLRKALAKLKEKK